MNPENHSADSLSAVVENPFVKAVLAVMTLYGFIAKYIKSANKRRLENAAISNRFKFGWIFWSVQRMPFIFHALVAYAALIGAAIELATLIDQFVLNGENLARLPLRVQSVVGYFSSHFVWFFLVAFLLYVLLDVRTFEHAIAWFFGLFPRMRRTIDWANAEWQLKPESERRILAPSAAELRQTATRIVDELVGAARGNSLALRPEGLSDEDAANILYFGHVVEEYCATYMKLSFPWTLFYEALGKVALESGAPFSVGSLKQYASDNGFFPTVRRANAYLAPEHQIPNDPGLEQGVESGFKTLRRHFHCDARRLARGFRSTDYSCVLHRSNRFLESSGMRRQFAKLFILWRIKPHATHPDMFRVPFNTNIFVRYMDDGVIRVDGSRFDRTSELVDICFEQIQWELVKRVYDFLTTTQDASRVAWRNKEKADIDKRHIDWTWWVYYRADVQTYHDSRTYNSPGWKRQGDEVFKVGESASPAVNEAANDDEAPVES